MAIITKYLVASTFFLFSAIAMGHTIYAPNDIPLLDNRFRIDPNTEQITFIFNHKKGYQRVVLVRPDGSKLYQERHSDNVAWVSSKIQDIVTIQKPMTGPWQAVAALDGDNRIRIINEVQLKVGVLPLKLYSKEYITTNASLYNDKNLMDNPAYLDDAKLSISLLGGANKKMALYQDDGKHYDELPFDGQLTAHLYVDLQPGRYLLQISTKNDIFFRNVNKDAVVFPAPINYKIQPLNKLSEEANITFHVDDSEIDPTSVSVTGVIKDIDNTVIEQIIMHSIDNLSDKNEFSTTQKLPFGMYSFSGKAYATTRSGREIELQLSEINFELLKPFVLPEKTQSVALPTNTDQANDVIDNVPEQDSDTSLFANSWIIITFVIILLIIITGVIFLLLRRKKTNINEENTHDLSLDELQPMPIDMSEGK